MSSQTPVSSPSPSTFNSPAPSSSFSTSSTPFTTPASNRSYDDKAWGLVKSDELEEESERAPKGFRHLDVEYAEEVGGQGAARRFDWQVKSETNSTAYERRMGPTEASYYLGSRGQGVEGGVNDMYLHIGFTAPSNLLSEARIFEAWKVILARHPLLWSTARFKDYYDVHFVNRVPANEAEFDGIVRTHFELKTAVAHDTILDEYLNGERTLNDEKLAYLVISTPESTFSLDSSEQQRYDFFLYSTHFLGDGMALHTTTNEFFSLLHTPSLSWSSVDPASLISFKEGAKPDFDRFPPALESKVVTSKDWGKSAWAAAKIVHQQKEARLIGGQTFPRAKLGPRKTLVPTVSYSLEVTKRILSTCKSRSSTIANALFALSNLAYIRSTPDDKLDCTLPTNLYSALNVRGFLEKDEKRDWYHIAIGYYNIILPSFFASTIDSSTAFWSQAASVKSQTSKTVKNRFLTSRIQLMALERESRSIGFEKADELKRRKAESENGVVEKLEGLGISTKKSEESKVDKLEEMRIEANKVEESKKKNDAPAKASTKVPNASLMGLSMLGNLDAIYRHDQFPSIKLTSLTTGSRQRPSALLLFAYTFAGKLWISLGYDSNGFEEGVIDNWWKELLNGVDEFLLEKKSE